MLKEHGLADKLKSKKTRIEIKQYTVGEVERLHHVKIQENKDWNARSGRARDYQSEAVKIQENKDWNSHAVPNFSFHAWLKSKKTRIEIELEDASDALVVQ